MAGLFTPEEIAKGNAIIRGTSGTSATAKNFLFRRTPVGKTTLWARKLGRDFLNWGGVQAMARYPKTLGMVVGTGVFLGSTIKTMKRTVNFRPMEKSTIRTQGPGFIAWSKSAGMPANHLSTDGLSLALSNTRHTSLIK